MFTTDADCDEEGDDDGYPGETFIPGEYFEATEGDLFGIGNG